MAKVHRIPLPGPFWSLEVLELDALDTNADGAVTGVKRLYLVDPHSSRGLRLLKSLPRVPVMAGFPTSIADDRCSEEIEVVE